jgi:predicted aldo/keto reductase-like oxidoreductase
MRLPTMGGNPAHMDEEAATSIIHQAIDAGVNYFDTACRRSGSPSS